MSKSKTYYVSHTIYVGVDIKAKSPEEAEEKFDDLVRDEKKFIALVWASESDTDINEA